MNANNHHHYMSLALQLAQKGRYTVSPNPMVGCVIVKDDKLIGSGYHVRAGEPHAEIYALREAGKSALGATLYVTLEPCCHSGRTPPCTEQLIQSGIKKVVIACADPNPLVAGKGANLLQNAGIEVEIGMCAAEARQLNEIFFHYIKHKRPFVIAKWAMSLDGKTKTNSPLVRDISCHATKPLTHQLRESVDAIVIGAETAKQDNPLLTVRYADNASIAKHPVRVILASSGNLPLDLQLFASTPPSKTIVAVTDKADIDWCHALEKMNIEVLRLPRDSQDKIALPALLDELGKREFSSILVEGGMTLHESFFRDQLVNKIHVYIAPRIIGSMNSSIVTTNNHFVQIDTDMHITANIEENPDV